MNYSEPRTFNVANDWRVFVDVPEGQLRVVIPEGEFDVVGAEYVDGGLLIHTTHADRFYSNSMDVVARVRQLSFAELRARI